MNRAAPGRALALCIWGATLWACEFPEAPAGPPMRAIDAGAVQARSAAATTAATEAVDGIRSAATAATPPLDAGQKSGVNE